MRIYRLLVWFLRAVTAAFFRSVEVAGDPPLDGPTIFVGNHPNSLLDPLLITTTCGRTVHFAAKDVLFESRLLRVVLRGLGAVPIRRRRDHGGGAVDNDAAFAALFEILGRGGAFGIFPEGISHTGTELAPLKTGAARIALGAAAQGATVQVVPSGLVYHRPRRFRSRVLVQYGEPIEVDATWAARFAADPREAVSALTDEIALALRAQTINAPDFETLRLLESARRIYVPLGARLPLSQRAELTRRFLDHYAQYASHPEIAALERDLTAHLERRRALGVSDRTLTAELSPSAWLWRAVRHALLLFVLAPLALPGLLIHAPIWIMAVVAGDGLTQRKDVIATTKMMTSVLLMPLAYAALVAGAWTLGAGWLWTLTLGVALPASGLATIRVLEQQAALRRGAWVGLRLLHLRRELDALRAERRELRERLEQAVDRFMNTDLQRIVPPRDPDH